MNFTFQRDYSANRTIQRWLIRYRNQFKADKAEFGSKSQQFATPKTLGIVYSFPMISTGRKSFMRKSDRKSKSDRKYKYDCKYKYGMFIMILIYFSFLTLLKLKT